MASEKVKKRSPRAWDALTPPLAEWIRDAVATMGFSQMTPVQAATLPHFLGNKDVVVEAVTGSGKTLAFLIPLVQKLLRLSEPTKKHHVAAIIVSPTRELAAQIHTVLVNLLQFHEASAEILPHLKGDEKRPSTTVPAIVPQLLVGGTTTTAQDLSFFLRHSPNVLISSPGRLVELLSSPHVHCPQSSFEVLVLDEADRLLDLGFKPDLQKILSHLPKQRRTGLFSASVSEAVGEIIRPASQKLPALAELLRQLPIKPQRSIVFLSTCAAVDYFQHVLPAILPEGFALVPLHGKHPAKVREKNFNRFLNSVAPTILLTTDLAARGLDIPQVDLVVQIDAPSDPKAFIHRSGRAGRAGRKGLAVVMLHPGREEDYVQFLEIRKTPISKLEKPTVFTSEEDAVAATKKMRDLVLTDRALFDKAQKGFVSWARSYGAHQATSIFRAADLDWADLGNAWGLLRMPRMPELKSWKGDKMCGLEIDWDNYAYKEKTREQARKAALEEERSGEKKDKSDETKRKRKNNEAWSAKHEKEDERVERREKRRKRREAEATSKMTDEEKFKQMELNELIAEVRRQNREKAAAEAAAAKKDKEDEFAGFDD
ncbi:hypothetical protein AU210_010879 [Fusarium oxysporum f. sp. radicis-cucumerinum]|uniref:ATP-dependent RNA helicase n=1 Tax=Fusarium oxysporum f. sp. radicis-cucumerinum TaxID=327505 RepID=A0A2H3GKX9_FUSOX|nr:hypothetical protein AU210_010879 [Fusarium oxysporum f. sp. radicis-cucumerinum]